MTTTTSSFRKGGRGMFLYRWALRGQIPFLLIIAIAFFLMIGVPLLTVLLSHDGELAREYGMKGIYVKSGQKYMVWAALAAMAGIMALVSGHYMHSKKMVDLYHALPVTRTQLLGSQFLASMTTIVVPYLAVYLCALLGKLLYFGKAVPFGREYLLYIVADLATGIVYILAVYLFTLLISVNVGTVLDTFAITGCVGLTLTFLYMVLTGVWTAEAYGAQWDVREVLFLLSPFTFPFQEISYQSYQNGMSTIEYGKIFALLLFWLAFAGLCLAGALFCYKRRRSELAEQTRPGAFLQIIVKCLAAFCGAFLFYLIFAVAPMPVQLIFMVVGALLLGLVAEMILARGIRTARKSFKWLLGTGVSCAAVVCLMSVGVLNGGYTQYVPDVDMVESVEISYNGRFDDLGAKWMRYGESTSLTDPQAIATITRAHRIAVDNPPPHSEYYDSTEFKGYLYLEYRLKNGKTVSRWLYPANNAAFEELLALEANDDFIASRSFFFYPDTSSIPQTKAIDYVAFYDSFGNQKTIANLTEGELDMLLGALRADMLAEPLDEITNPSQDVAGIIEVAYKDYHAITGRGEDDYSDPFFVDGYSNNTFRILVGPGYAATIRVLEEIGGDVGFPQAEMPDAVYLLPWSSWGDYFIGEDTDRVFALLHMDYGAEHLENMMEYQEVLGPFRDAELIEELMAKGRSQLQLDTLRRRGTALAVFYSGGESIGIKMVPVADLPADIQMNLSNMENDGLLPDYDQEGMEELEVR